MNVKTTSKPANYSSIADRLPKPFVKIDVMETCAGYLLEYHAHEYYHVNHITDGLLEVGISGRSFEVRAGQTVILPPIQPHRLYSETGYRQIGMDVLDCRDERGLSQLLTETTVKKFSVTGVHVVGVSYTDMSALLDSPSLPNRLKSLNLAEGILLAALETLGHSDPRRDRFTVSFNSMLSKERNRNLTLGDMCASLGMSRAQLERTAHQVFGCGAVEYCQRLRFKEICTLLKTTDLTLDSIAELTGFYDAGHLSVFFGKRAGFTPGQYRNSGRIS